MYPYHAPPIIARKSSAHSMLLRTVVFPVFSVVTTSVVLSHQSWSMQVLSVESMLVFVREHVPLVQLRLAWQSCVVMHAFPAGQSAPVPHAVPQSLSASPGSNFPFSHMLGTVHVPLRHESPVVQSFVAVHVIPVVHAVQLPPQSFPVSLPFCCLSVQLGDWHVLLVLPCTHESPVWQSLVLVHVSPVVHVPQSAHSLLDVVFTLHAPGIVSTSIVIVCVIGALVSPAPFIAQAVSVYVVLLVSLSACPVCVCSMLT